MFFPRLKSSTNFCIKENMDLKIKEVARLLNQTEAQVRHLASKGQLPSYEMNGQLRFNRNEVEAWVMNYNQKNGAGLHAGIYQHNLYRAIYRGGVLNEIEGATKVEVIRNAMQDLATRCELDGEVLTNLVMEREELMTTGLGGGIAVPHARDFLIPKPFDLVTVVFPQNAIAYGALDGKPVHALFFLFASQDQRHLSLLAKIAHLASNPKAQKLLTSNPSKTKLLHFIKEWESSLYS